MIFQGGYRTIRGRQQVAAGRDGMSDAGVNVSRVSLQWVQ